MAAKATPASRTLLITLGGVAIVVIAFAVTSYFVATPPGGQSATGGKTGGPVVSPPAAQSSAGTNLVAQSANFDGPQWQLARATISPSAAPAPDGTSTGFRFSETTDNGLHRIVRQVNGVSAGDVYTVSFFVKPDERKGVELEMADVNGGKYGTVLYNAAHKAVLGKTGDVVAAGIEVAPDGWYRCWAAMPYATKAATFDVTLLDDRNSNTYQGDGKSGLFLWGADFELGSQPTQYAGINAAK